jgi:hypothetical protein
MAAETMQGFLQEQEMDVKPTNLNLTRAGESMTYAPLIPVYIAIAQNFCYL